jgi:glycosyltransferase involved in cell wall biosynthesis
LPPEPPDRQDRIAGPGGSVAATAASHPALDKRVSPPPTVTTVIPTYNQEGFIAGAIESAIAQTGHFSHEILVANDGSTDATQDVIDRYCLDYPGLVRSIGGRANLGISLNFRRCFEAAAGFYTAILEGDDYWTDTGKLAAQVAFLDGNPDCSMVFSKILVHNTATDRSATLERQDRIGRDRLGGQDFLDDPNMNLIANFSCCMFRSRILKHIPKIMYSARVNEIAIAFYFDRFGRIGFIDREMSVYRQHASGVWTGSDRTEQLRSGLRAREIALAVADPAFKPGIQRIVDQKYLLPLSKIAS